MVVCAVLALGTGGMAFAGPSAAQETQSAASSLTPQIPKAKGDRCVADTAIMRRDHMEFLKHQRDETVHEGVRTERFSLKECLACHAVEGPDARPVTADSPDHFCRVCHDYAAVRIDCFDCHASRPDDEMKSALPPGHAAELALRDFARSLRP